MGPPLKAAENTADNTRTAPQNTRFNGAAAKSSGKWKARASLLAEKLTLQWGRR